MNNIERLKLLEEKKLKGEVTNRQYHDIKEALEIELCKNNLAYLVTQVLDPEYYAPLLEDFHYQMMNFAEKEGKRKLILVPRGHLKSSVVTIPKALQRILKNPNSRVLITSAVLGNSSDFLRSVKGYMEGNEKLKSLFGEFVSDKWNEVEIIVKQRKKKQIKEPSIMASSTDKSIVSKHFDLIIADDLVNRESINTKEQLEKTKTYLKDLLDLLDPDGELIVIGTRWHYDDLYADLLDGEQFEVFFRSCYDDDGEPIFKNKFSKEILEQLLKEKGTYDFSCQYKNSPIDDETATFKESWIKYYDELPPFKTYNWYLTLDTNGGGESVNADFNGWCLNAVDQEDNWFIEAYHDKVNLTEIINRMFELDAKLPYLKIGLEKTMYANALRQELYKEMERRGKYLNIVEIVHNKTSKEARITGLVPRFENGKIYIKKGSEDLRDEYLRFPKARHDDIIDSLAMQQEIAVKPYPSLNQEDFSLYKQQTYY